MVRLFDLHCDTLSKAYRLGIDLFSPKLHISSDKLDAFLPYVQITAIFTDDKKIDTDGFSEYLSIIEFYLKKGLRFAKSSAELTERAFILSIEDARILENDLSRLELFRSHGVRLITPVWKGVNRLGGAWDTDIGLSDFGKDAIKRMIDLGITPDTSHCSVRSFDAILELCSERGAIPVATHSNSYSVCNHKRNLDKRQFLSLVSIGSIVGISLAPSHLVNSGVATIDDILRHIDAYLCLGGENTVCMGCDFDGISSLPEGISGISSLEGLYFIIEKHYGTSVADKIFYKNAYNFVSKRFFQEDTCLFLR